MSSQSIGRGALILTTDQTLLDSGIAQAKAKVNGLANHAATVNEKATKLGDKTRAVLAERVGGGIGGLGEFFGLAGGAGVGLAVTGTLAAMELYLQRTNKQLERGAELAERFNEKFSAGKYAEKALERIKGFQDIEGRPMRFAQAGEAQKALSEAQKSASSLETALGKARERLDRLTDASMQFKQIAPAIGDALGIQGETHYGAIEQQENAVKQLEKQYLEALEAVKKLKEQQQGIFRPELSEAVIKGVQDLTARLRTQVQEFGKSASEIDLYKLKMQGATDAQLSNARALAQQLEGLEKAKKVTDSITELTTQLRVQADTFGLSATEAAIYKLRLDGATESQLANVRQLSRQIDALTEADKKLDQLGQKPGNAAAALFGSKEALAIEGRFRLDGLLGQTGNSAGKSLEELKAIRRELVKLNAEKSLKLQAG